MNPEYLCPATGLDQAQAPADGVAIATWNVQHAQSCTPTGGYPQFMWRPPREASPDDVVGGGRASAAAATIRALGASCHTMLLQEVRSYNIQDILEQFDFGGSPAQTHVAKCEYGRRVGPDGTRDMALIITDGTVQCTLEDSSYGLLAHVTVGRRELILGSVHFPLARDERFKAARALAHNIASLEASVGKRIDAVAIGGDFNAFPDDGGREQMHELCARARLLDATQFLVRGSDGRRAYSTYRPYPWDRPPLLADPDKLDYVCTRGLVPVLAACMDDMQTACRHGASAYGPSDHFPVVMVARYCDQKE